MSWTFSSGFQSPFCPSCLSLSLSLFSPAFFFHLLTWKTRQAWCELSWFMCPRMCVPLRTHHWVLLLLLLLELSNRLTSQEKRRRRRERRGFFCETLLSCVLLFFYSSLFPFFLLNTPSSWLLKSQTHKQHTAFNWLPRKERVEPIA